MTRIYTFDELWSRNIAAHIRQKERMPDQTFLNHIQPGRPASRSYIAEVKRGAVFKLEENLINDGTFARVRFQNWRAESNGLVPAPYQPQVANSRVIDLIGKYWGVIGEIGVAIPQYDENGERVFQVIENPGRPIYHGGMKSGEGAWQGGTSKVCQVTIDGAARDVTVWDNSYLGAKTLPDGTTPVRWYFNPSTKRFELLDSADCPQ